MNYTVQISVIHAQCHHSPELTSVRARILQSYLGPTARRSRDPRRKSALCHSEPVCVTPHMTLPQWSVHPELPRVLIGSKDRMVQERSRRESWQVRKEVIAHLVFFWTFRGQAVLNRCSHRCTPSRHPAGRPCAWGRSPRRRLSSRERIHIFLVQPRSPHQSHPSLTVRRRHFPSTACLPFTISVSEKEKTHLMQTACNI